MNFNSDNWAGAHPLISENLTRHSHGMQAAYGDSDLDKKVAAQFNELFEREVALFFVGTGTAANSLALAAVNRPGGVSFCHQEAHLVKDEGGAPESFTGGGRLQTVSGRAGRIDPAELESELSRFRPDFVHAGQAMAVSLTQATEVGTVYQPAQIGEIASLCQQRGLPLHLDGARFANALVTLDCSPAEMTWKAGVDIVSFGGTKNGCWCAEALLFLNPAQANEMPYLRKRSAQLFSKTRFIAAQFEAYLENDLWLQLARHANDAAQQIQQIAEASPCLSLAWPVEANEVFLIASQTTMQHLQKEEVGFYQWPLPEDLRQQLAPDDSLLRLVTNYQTSSAELDRFRAVVTALEA